MELKDIKKTKSDTKFISCRIPKKHHNFIRQNKVDVRKMIVKLIEELPEFKKFKGKE